MGKQIYLSMNLYFCMSLFFKETNDCCVRKLSTNGWNKKKRFKHNIFKMDMTEGKGYRVSGSERGMAKRACLSLQNLRFICPVLTVIAHPVMVVKNGAATHNTWRILCITTGTNACPIRHT